MHLGSWLTAVSGMLNACWMVRAHLDARPNAQVLPVSSRAWIEVLAGWSVPGLGHLLQKRFARGVAVFVLLVGLFLLGTFLADGSNLDRERHFYYWGGQFLLGAPVVLLEGLHGHAHLTRDLAYVDAGLVMVCLAGLLNVLALLDVFCHSEARVQSAKSPRMDLTVREARATP
jgi:hypothetical protein